MGREIRMVPANWKHPETKVYDPFKQRVEMRKQPMYDRYFDDAAAEWKAEFAKWEAGEWPAYCSEEDKAGEYWEWDSPPDRAYHRPWKDGEGTWFQVWETVTKGTPVTPPFATQEELVNYLVANGDESDQISGKGGWSQLAAESFVGSGWAPSLIVVNGPTGGIYAPRDGSPV